MPRTLSTADLGRELGVCRRTITQWVADGLPSELDDRGRRRFDLDEVDRWNAARAAEPPLTEPPLSICGIDAAEADRRRAVARAEMAELQLARERGEVVDVAGAIREQQGLLLSIKRALEFLPRRVAARTCGLTTLAEVEAALVNECRDALRAIPDQAWALLAPEERPM
jgi:phage terminase Nu1 subunit (DNA packaging protein)